MNWDFRRSSIQIQIRKMFTVRKGTERRFYCLFIISLACLAFFLAFILVNSSNSIFESRTIEEDEDVDEYFPRIFLNKSKCLFKGEKGQEYSDEMCVDGVFQGIGTDAGLGNVVFELLSFMGMAEASGRLPIFTSQIVSDRINLLQTYLPSMYNFLKETEKNKRKCGCATKYLETVNKCCVYDRPTISQLKDQTHRTIRLRGIFTQSFKYIKHIPEEIMETMFESSEEVKKQAAKLFPEEIFETNNTKICVHMRLGDFTNSTLVYPSSENFTMAAIEYVLGTKNENATLLAFSNDENTTLSYFEGFENFYHATSDFDRPANVEWEFSKHHCDVFIMTAPVSTYGWWMAYLSKGKEVYYNKHFSKPGGIEIQLRPDDFWPRTWIPLKLNLDGTVEEQPW